MTEEETFALNSDYFRNIAFHVNFFAEEHNKKFSIIINNKYKIEIPLILATLISKEVNSILRTDKTVNEMRIQIKEKKNLNTALEKVKKVINSETIIFENIEEKKLFADFGLKIGNSDFIVPIIKVLEKESNNLNTHNVINILTSKQKYGYNNAKKETDYIAKNFQYFVTNDEFINYAKNIDNITFVEDVISSEYHEDDENNKVLFIISLARENNYDSQFLRLFKFVDLYNCNQSICHTYISFLYEFMQDSSVFPLIECMKKQFLTEKVGKIAKRGIINNKPDGLFALQYSKSNLCLRASSTLNSNVFNILKPEGSPFMTYDENQAFIKGSMINKAYFTITGYFIRAWNSTDYQLQSWKLVGKTRSDKIVVLDEHRQEPFGKFQMKIFKIECKEKLKSIKLIHTGDNTGPDHFGRLSINSFDVIGSVC